MGDIFNFLDAKSKSSAQRVYEAPVSGAEIHILKTGPAPVIREPPPPVADRPALDEDDPQVITQAPVFEPGCEVSTYPDAPCDMEPPPKIDIPPGVFATIQERERKRTERLASLNAHIAPETPEVVTPPVTNYTLFRQSCRTTFAIWKLFWKIMWGFK